MRQAPTLFDYWRTGLELWRLGFETNNVILLRMMGFAGVWNTPFDESWRMVAEKPQAFLKAGHDGMRAVMSGAEPDKVLNASVRHLNRTTRANRKRLSRRGLRKP